MKIKLLALLISLPVLVGAVASLGAETETRSLTIKPLFDLRIRQEILDGVYHFDPVEQDRNWVRYRTRAGAHLTSGDHEVQLRLANENRSYLTPDDVDHDWDEVIIDRAQWTWHASESTRLDVGRQDIVWDDGFLMLDPYPLDGSRSMYHTAVRLRTKRDHTDLDVSLIHNPRRDHLVLIDDQERALCDADETAVAVHVSAADWRFSGIWKYEDFTGDLFPLTTWTLGLRREGDLGRSGRFRVEAAVQYQDFDLSDQPSGGLLRDEDYDGWAFALQAFGRAPIAARTDLEAGVFYYSGADQGSQRAFRTPWGRWPKWSDLYIYTLIGESTPGRVHVAAWENIAAPRVTLYRELKAGIDGRLGVTYLTAPEPVWAGRGLLLQTGLTFDLKSVLHGLQGHLLWEMFEPGSFHTGNTDYPTLDETTHFIRWQLTYALK